LITAGDPMPNARLRTPVCVAAAVVLPILLFGCGESKPTGPDAAQAGDDLGSQVYKFLFVTTTTDVKVTDPLYDKFVPCQNGLVKITYAVSGKANRFATGSFVTRNETKKSAKPREIIDDLVRYMPQVGTFAVVQHPGDNATVDLVNTATHTRLKLHSSGPNRLAINGETDCLRAGKLTH
jgi:hypothetical protein